MEIIGTQVKSYKCPSYLPTFKDGVSTIKEEFCDAKLVAGGRVFKGHKIILAANSRYFHSIFVRNFNERQSEEVRMPPEINAEAMQTLLDYFYSGELVLSAENIESVFRATDYMRLDPLLEICIEYMHEKLVSSTCVRRYMIADPIPYPTQRLDDFKKRASALIVEEAVKIPDLADFSSLSSELISKIVKLNNEPEKAENVCVAILTWVGHDVENRMEFLYNLLQMLPVEGISDEFFTKKLKNEELVRKDHQSLQWLLDSFMLRLASPVLERQNPQNSLFITDRWAGSTGKCFCLNLPHKTLRPICDRPTLFYFSAACHKNRMFLLGAENTRQSFRLDESQKAWVDTELDLDFGRCHAGCAVLGDDLFVIGGFQNGSLNSCMKFDFGSGRKEHLPAMASARILPGVAVYANSVYAACGSGSSSSIERFDLREGRWFAVGSYKTNIDWCSSATLDHSLYSCDVIIVGKVHRFDFRTNQSPEKDCTSPLLKLKWISSVDGSIYGITDYDVQKYEAATDTWNVFCSNVDLFAPIIVPWV